VFVIENIEKDLETTVCLPNCMSIFVTDRKNHVVIIQMQLGIQTLRNNSFCWIKIFCIFSDLVYFALWPLSRFSISFWVSGLRRPPTLVWSRRRRTSGTPRISGGRRCILYSGREGYYPL